MASLTTILAPPTFQLVRRPPLSEWHTPSTPTTSYSEATAPMARSSRTVSARSRSFPRKSSRRSWRSSGVERPSMSPRRHIREKTPRSLASASCFTERWLRFSPARPVSTRVSADRCTPSSPRSASTRTTPSWAAPAPSPWALPSIRKSTARRASSWPTSATAPWPAARCSRE